MAPAARRSVAAFTLLESLPWACIFTLRTPAVPLLITPSTVSYSWQVEKMLWSLW